MTKKERELIKRAIYLIHNSNEYYEGMDILAKLVGYKTISVDKRFCKRIKITPEYLKGLE